MSTDDGKVQIDHLLYRVQRRDTLALKTLYDLASAKLLGIIVRIVNDKQEAEDVLQDVFLKVWNQSHQYRGAGSAWGWLCVLTRNAALDRVRQLKTRACVSTDSDESLLDTLHFSDEHLPDRYAIQRCLSGLKTLPRKAILMSFVHGYTHSELAVQLATPVGTIKAWVRRGLQELKQCLSV